MNRSHLGRKTKFGVIRNRDIAVATTDKNELLIVFFTNINFGDTRNCICFNTFSPARGVCEQYRRPLEEFEATTKKLSVFDSLGVHERWVDFVDQYKNYLRIKRAERLLANHLAHSAIP